MSRSRELGAAALLTGHYVESRQRSDGSGRRDLLSAADTSRDQSYFLFATTQVQLDFLRFPLASLTKAETRQIATALGLAVADKPDSQDICFVPEGRYADVIARLRPEAMEAGDIAHVDGRVLGRHEGVLNFTVGQRRGLGIADGAPLYVTRIDAPARRVIVGPRQALAGQDMMLGEVNWLGDEPIGRAAKPVHARIRSTRAPVAAVVARNDEGVSVRLEAPEYGISPGQACVFYERPGPGARVLGGGFIAAQRKGALHQAALAVT
jgi:tRNA-uridine 2-sulfurtransferase